MDVKGLKDCYERTRKEASIFHEKLLGWYHRGRSMEASRRNELISKGYDQLSLIKPLPFAIGWLSSMITFVGAKYLNVWINHLLRISNDQIIISKVTGLIGLFSSSFFASHTFMTVYNHTAKQSGSRPLLFPSFAISFPSSLSSLSSITLYPPRHFLIDSIVMTSLASLSYWMIGGRLSRFSPSNLFTVGPFGKKSLPASLTAYATPTEKAILNNFARQYGCHHCGRRYGVRRLFPFIRNVSYIGDHIPPSHFIRKASRRLSVRLASKYNYVPKSLRQRFLPQCEPCSNKQAHAVKNETRTLVMPKTLRYYDMFLPWPIIMLILFPFLHEIDDGKGKGISQKTITTGWW